MDSGFGWFAVNRCGLHSLVSTTITTIRKSPQVGQEEAEAGRVIVEEGHALAVPRQGLAPVRAEPPGGEERGERRPFRLAERRPVVVGWVGGEWGGVG